LASTSRLGSGTTRRRCPRRSHGHTTIGARNRIFPFRLARRGAQDQKYAGEPTRLGNSATTTSSVSSVPSTSAPCRIAARPPSAATTGIMAYAHTSRTIAWWATTHLCHNAFAGRACRNRRLGDPGRLHRCAPVLQDRAHVMTGISAGVFKDIPHLSWHRFRVQGGACQRRMDSITRAQAARIAPESLAALSAPTSFFTAKQHPGRGASQACSEAVNHAEVQQLLDFLARSERGIIR